MGLCLSVFVGGAIEAARALASESVTSYKLRSRCIEGIPILVGGRRPEVRAGCCCVSDLLVHTNEWH